MNKTKFLIVAILAACSLAGCGRNNNTDTSPSPSPAVTNDANVGDGNTSGNGVMDNAGKAVQDIGNGVGQAMDNAGNAVRDITGAR